MSREAFEKWAADQTFLIKAGDDYINVRQMAWEAWQAALESQSAQPKVPDGWTFSRITEDLIQVKHPDTSEITVADKGPIHNMMFYELCLAMLSAQEENKIDRD